MFAFAAVSKNQGPLVSLMQVGNYGRAARCGDISLPTLNRAPLATVLQCYSATVLQCYSEFKAGPLVIGLCHSWCKIPLLLGQLKGVVIIPMSPVGRRWSKF
mgnify:FL=1